MFKVQGDVLLFDGYRVGVLATDVPATVRDTVQEALESVVPPQEAQDWENNVRERAAEVALSLGTCRRDLEELQEWLNNPPSRW